MNTVTAGATTETTMSDFSDAQAEARAARWVSENGYGSDTMTWHERRTFGRALLTLEALNAKQTKALGVCAERILALEAERDELKAKLAYLSDPEANAPNPLEARVTELERADKALDVHKALEEWDAPAPTLRSQLTAAREDAARLARHLKATRDYIELRPRLRPLVADELLGDIEAALAAHRREGA